MFIHLFCTFRRTNFGTEDQEGLVTSSETKVNNSCLRVDNRSPSNMLHSGKSIQNYWHTYYESLYFSLSDDTFVVMIEPKLYKL